MNFIIKSKSALLADLKAHSRKTKDNLHKKLGVSGDFDFKTLPVDVKDERLNDVYQALYGGKLVMTESDVQDGESTFQSHYTAVNNTPALYNVLTFPWLAFSQTALEGMNPDEFILGLIHCYDANSGNWYLTAERFTFAGYSGPGEYPISTTDTLFTLLPDGTVGSYTGGLQEYNGHLNDPVYFSNVLYNNVVADPALNVNRLAFAWEEVKQLFCDNKANIPGADDSLFSINFCSISSDYSAEVPNSVLVPFPHCVAMYMSYDGVPLLTDGSIVTSAQFYNKAADFNTLCPNKCNTYNWPAGLEPKNNC